MKLIKTDSMKYNIRYQHTSADSATSLQQALKLARWTVGASRLYRAVCPDGIYLYASLRDLRRDTGENADAVVTKG